MLTREQGILLDHLTHRHATQVACLICPRGTFEWEVASRQLQFRESGGSGDKFSGTAEMLRAFFEEVNEKHAHEGEGAPVTLYSLLHGC